MKPSYILLLTIALNLVSCLDIKQSDYVDVEYVRQGIKDNKIRRFKEEEILQQAYFRGEQIRLSILECRSAFVCDSILSLSCLSDSLKKFVYQMNYYCQFPKNLPEKAQQIWQAYEYTSQTKASEIPSIVQKVGQDSLLYPIYILQEGAPYGFGMVAIWMSRKQIVKSLY
ncbi:MAG: hypothetical protein NZM38_08165 [Cytophagales bacterium]|nr:hypothetical protein [Cytophagales bacterium]MDW8384731.1 hypothetical protein [Flammeovirgaceae bacterium]